MPLPNTRLIHPRFEAHHRPVADGQMTAECVVTRPTSAGVFDADAGRTTYPPPARVYPAVGDSGPCRILRQHSQPVAADVGDRAVTVDNYRVTLPAGTSAQINDLVRVTACDGDPTLVGQELIVRDLAHASITWQRDLICDLYPATSR